MTEQRAPEQPSPEQTPARPQGRPEYGEYAPEGWVSPVQSSQTSEPAASGASPRAATDPSERPAQVPSNVPHNLGVGAPSNGAPSNGAPIDVAPPSTSSAPPTSSPTPPAAPGAPAPQNPERPGSTADRIITILLLVVGAMGAVQFALGMMAIGTQIEIVADMLGADNIVIPQSVTVLQTFSAVVMLTIYAVALIWSVQRLRAKKITFWVPLAAGALAVILVIVLSTIAMTLVPELLEYSTPENLEILLEQFAQ